MTSSDYWGSQLHWHCPMCGYSCGTLAGDGRELVEALKDDHINSHCEAFAREMAFMPTTSEPTR